MQPQSASPPPSAFCIHCGSPLAPGTTFCIACGKPVSPVPAVRKQRKWPWILALILLFVLGFLLGRLGAPKCPACPPPLASGGAGGGSGGGGGHTSAGSGGPSDPSGGGGGGGASGLGRVLGEGGKVDGGGGGGALGSGQGTGDMQSGGTSNASGTVVGNGYDSSAVGASGSDDGGSGPSGGKTKVGDAPNGNEVDRTAQDPVGTGVLRLAAGGPMTYGGDSQQADFKDKAAKVLSARDFTYDKTNLPRYPEANQAVFSALSYDVADRSDTYGSASAIVTGRPFDEAVAWYRKNLPAGWSNTTVSDFNRLGAVAQQFSPDKIMQMIAGAKDATPVSSAEIPATAATDRIRLSLFSPPAGTPGDLGVMIVQPGDKPVEIFMRTHIKP